MRLHYKTSFVEEDGHPVYGEKITGFLHTCRKKILTYCFCCMENIVKGDQYIDFYSVVYGGERAHLKCYDFSEEGQWLAIKRKFKKTWIVKLFKNDTKTQDNKQ